MANAVMMVATTLVIIWHIFTQGRENHLDVSDGILIGTGTWFQILQWTFIKKLWVLAGQTSHHEIVSYAPLLFSGHDYLVT